MCRLFFDFYFVCFKSIWMAHQNMRLAKVIYTDGEIHDANINRSPEAYEANPQKERDM